MTVEATEAVVRVVAMEGVMEAVRRAAATTGVTAEMMEAV